MKKSSDLAIIGIGIYVFNQLVLSVALLESFSFIDSLKGFTPIWALQDDFFGGKARFFYILSGVINLVLVGVMAFLIVNRSKESGSTPKASITSFGTSVPNSHQD
jgi:hypothetical protein